MLQTIYSDPRAKLDFIILILHHVRSEDGNSSLTSLRFCLGFVSDPSKIKIHKKDSIKISEKILKKKIRDNFHLSRSFKIDFLFLPEGPLSITV